MQTNFKRLSFLESTFLVMEGPTNPMPVEALLILEAGVLRREENRAVDIDAARAHIVMA